MGHCKGCGRMILLAVAVILATAWTAQAQEVREKSWDERYGEATSAERIEAAVARERDAGVLMGLSLLANRGNADILRRISEIMPNGVPAYYALQYRLNEEQAAAFVDVDPFNALAHYALVQALCAAGRPQEAMESFRRGAKCKTIRTYRKEAAESLFKALDALGVEGALRLHAIGQARWRRFQRVQPLEWRRIQRVAGQTAGMGEEDKRVLAENLMAYAGQVLDAKEEWPRGKWSAYTAMAEAFRIREGMVREKDAPERRAYREAADLARAQAQKASREMGGGWERFAWAVELALGGVEEVGRDVSLALRIDPTIDEETRAVLELLKSEVGGEAVESFLESAATDVDGKLGLWLWMGDNEAQRILEDESGDLASEAERVARLVNEARNTMMEKAPAIRERYDLKQLGLSVGVFMTNNNEEYPPNIETLFEKRYLQSYGVPKSDISGEPVVYLGAELAGVLPSVGHVIAYDAAELLGDLRTVLFADLHVETISNERLEKILKEQKTLTGE